MSTSSLDATGVQSLQWLAHLTLGVVGMHRFIEASAAEFLDHLLEVNSSRVQSDILNRVQESRNRLEAEIRKLLHDVTRVAEQTLAHARAAQEAGAPGVEKVLARLDGLEEEIRHCARLAGRDYMTEGPTKPRHLTIPSAGKVLASLEDRA